MSTTKKLSETLQDYEEFEGFNSAAANGPQLIDAAQALEERVAELEGLYQDADLGRMMSEGLRLDTERFLDAALVRAEAADAEVARLRGLVEQYELPEDVYEENRTLRAKLEKVHSILESSAADSDPIVEAALAALDGEGGDDTFYEATKRLGWGDDET